MEKILISLAIIGVVAAIGIGATVAYFSDTEISTGNTFTAGSIDLTVDSQCTYNEVVSSQCGAWTLKDLNPTADKFWNFSDIKPGDRGENTISLHVENNDAYACFYVSPLSNNEKTCTEPEQVMETAAGHPCVVDAETGELAQNIQFFAWDDINGNNVWDAGELPLFTNTKGPASDVLSGKTYFLGQLTGQVTKFIGIYWCAGNLTATPGQPNVLACDGTAMGNDCQSDSMTGSVAFYVEQAKNNSNFTCPAAPSFQ